jgi:hypothetical protein
MKMSSRRKGRKKRKPPAQERVDRIDGMLPENARVSRSNKEALAEIEPESKRHCAPPLIQMTTKYELFKYDTANRRMTGRPIEKLALEMRTDFRLAIMPILVDHNWFIRDGQHRFMAAQINGYPIYYIRVKGLTPDMVAKMASLSHPWKVGDYLHSFCVREYPEYLKIRAFRDKTKLGHSVAMALLTGVPYGPEAQTKFHTGYIRVPALKMAEHIWDLLQGLSWYEHYKKKGFVIAFRELATHPKYDHKHLLRKMGMKRDLLYNAQTMESNLEILTKIYNWKVSKAKKVDFTKR